MSDYKKLVENPKIVFRTLGISDDAGYAAIKSGQIPAIRFGRLLKVPVSWLEETLNASVMPRKTETKS